MDVPNNPHLFSGEAFPITDQIQDNLVRSGVEIATCRYTKEEEKVFVSIFSAFRAPATQITFFRLDVLMKVRGL